MVLIPELRYSDVKGSTMIYALLVVMCLDAVNMELYAHNKHISGVRG